MKNIKQMSVSILVLIAIWELVIDFGLLPRALIPSFLDVIKAGYELMITGILPQNYAITSIRAVTGFIMGFIFGFLLGIFISTKSLQNYIQPIATLFFAVPSVAWIPILIVWIGLKEFALPVAASFVCSFPPILYGTFNSFRTFDAEQIGVAEVLGARPSEVFVRIVIPQVLLKLLPVIKVEAVMVWKAVFVAEMVALSSGLGYLAMVYSTTLDMAKLIACIVVLSLTTLGIIQALDHLEAKYSKRWLGDSKWLGLV